ncbi:MAG: DUF3810 domain-containing protein [Coriobacteriales bacterium]|jgi:hypothetical protein|nr:DUF3810 domain-containing protein [Coriobacteriales bacterium]
MNIQKTWLHLLRRYKVRHIIFAVAFILLCAYYLLRDLRPVADFASRSIDKPWYGLSGSLFGAVPFSVAEWLCVLAALGVLVHLGIVVYGVIRKPEKLQRIYAALVALLAGILAAYALLCWLWGIGFYSYTVPELSGIEDEAPRVEALKEVTISFAEAANEAGEAVNRDENGVFTCDVSSILNEAPTLYDDLPAEFAFLEGPGIRPKPMAFSYLMSHMNFTGFFFPFTGEANINTHAPDCFIPSTVAHELSHQRGVTREQDANFIAVVVCMESDEEDFVYSGALLAYIHLSNALRQASYEDWEEADSYLGDAVRRDLRANNDYWAGFETPAAEASEAAYTEFLHNQGQELGMRSYGACVDMLVSYYRSG